MRQTMTWSGPAALGMAVALAWGGAGWAAAAVVGKPAPEFSLTDSSGRARSLSEFKGQFVVLEWFNPECPFSRKHYGGNMQQLQARYTRHGVVWLSIDSSAPGKQGYLTPEQADAFIKERGVKSTAVLLDPDGKAGRLYGAKTTPHLFVIGQDGTVLYAGAIDDTPSADPTDIPRSANYVQRALDEAMAGKPVSIQETKSYGCSVKYQ